MNKYLSIEELENSKNKTLNFKVNDYIEGLDLVSPLDANLTATSLGEYIQIKGHVVANVKLICDFCLEEYESSLEFDIDELYIKNSLFTNPDIKGQEFEIKDGQFVTDLNGEMDIDIYDLLYQSVILNYPNKKVCGINCKGKDFLSEDEISDPRLEVFKDFQINE